MKKISILSISTFYCIDNSLLIHSYGKYTIPILLMRSIIKLIPLCQQYSIYFIKNLRLFNHFNVKIKTNRIHK